MRLTPEFAAFKSISLLWSHTSALDKTREHCSLACSALLREAHIALHGWFHLYARPQASSLSHNYENLSMANGHVMWLSEHQVQQLRAPSWVFTFASLCHSREQTLYAEMPGFVVLDRTILFQYKLASLESKG